MPNDHKPPLPVQRIVLVGFMGAGKSTVGALLAEKVGWRFVDLDRHIEAKSGSTIARIFSELGEAAFRQMETDAICELHRHREIVLALGGGALEAEISRSLLFSDEGTYVVFLKASFDVLVERCERQSNPEPRPVLLQRDTLIERFRSRLWHYEQAHAIVSTEGLSAELVAAEVLARLMMVDRTENSGTSLSNERAIAQ